MTPSFLVVDFAADLAWLRGLSFMTHLLIIAVFYCLWRLPGHSPLSLSSVQKQSDGLSQEEASSTTTTSRTSPTTADIWYDAHQEATAVDDQEPPLSAADDAWLSAQVPDSTPAERWRFFVAKNRSRPAAAAALQHYTTWRQQHDIAIDNLTDDSNDDTNEEEADDDDDLRTWNEASLIAQYVCKEKCTRTPLPKVAHLHQRQGRYLRDRTGHRLLHFLPGRMDDRLASVKTYATAVALYVDKRLDRHATERVTVVIDARGGHGWRNLNAAQLLPFIQHLSALMLALFPQRLHAATVFPIPSRFYWVWRLVRRCLDERTAAKIQPLEGPSTIDSPPPMAQMAVLLGAENAAFLEDFRKASFLA